MPSKTITVKIPRSRLTADITIGIGRNIGISFEWYKFFRPNHGSFYSLTLPFTYLAIDLIDMERINKFIQEDSLNDLARFTEMQMRLDDKKKENKTNSDQEGS